MQIGSCRKVLFSVFSNGKDLGKDLGADFYLDHFDIKALDGAVFNLNPTLHPFFGRHHYQNLLAAISVATYFGVGKEEIERAEKKLALPEKRFEIIDIKGITFVNDSYNASEISVIAALESLPKPEKQGRIIVVISELLELGKFSEGCHRRVAEKALTVADFCFLLGRECKPIFDCWTENGKPVEWFLELLELKQALKAEAKAGDVVLLKGSRANQLWKILEGF